VASSRKAFEPRREFDLDVGLERVEAGWTRDMADERPLPIDARLSPVVAVGVGGRVAPLVTEFRDSLRLRLLAPGVASLKKLKQIKRKHGAL